jgi:hypothetical protein
MRASAGPRFASANVSNWGIHLVAAWEANAIQRNVAANPPGLSRRNRMKADTPRRHRKRLALNDGGRRKREVRNEQQIPDASKASLLRCRISELVLHEVEVRRLVRPNRVHHRRIRAVRDGIADARLLAFKLIPELTIRAFEIDGLRVVNLPVQIRRRTVWTIKIVLAPPNLSTTASSTCEGGDKFAQLFANDLVDTQKGLKYKRIMRAEVDRNLRPTVFWVSATK